MTTERKNPASSRIEQQKENILQALNSTGGMTTRQLAVLFEDEYYHGPVEIELRTIQRRLKDLAAEKKIFRHSDERNGYIYTTDSNLTHAEAQANTVIADLKLFLEHQMNVEVEDISISRKGLQGLILRTTATRYYFDKLTSAKKTLFVFADAYYQPEDLDAAFKAFCENTAKLASLGDINACYVLIMLQTTTQTKELDLRYLPNGLGHAYLTFEQAKAYPDPGLPDYLHFNTVRLMLALNADDALSLSALEQSELETLSASLGEPILRMIWSLAGSGASEEYAVALLRDNILNGERFLPTWSDMLTDRLRKVKLVRENMDKAGDDDA